MGDGLVRAGWRPLSTRPFVAAAAYLVVMAIWIYVVMERQLFYGNTGANLALLAVLAAVQLAAGLLVGRWWALALPVLAVLLAIPAGYPDANKGEPWPISLSLLLWCPVALVLVGIGIVVAWRARADSSSSRRS